MSARQIYEETARDWNRQILRFYYDLWLRFSAQFYRNRLYPHRSKEILALLNSISE